MSIAKLFTIRTHLTCTLYQDLQLGARLLWRCARSARRYACRAKTAHCQPAARAASAGVGVVSRRELCWSRGDRTGAIFPAARIPQLLLSVQKCRRLHESAGRCAVPPAGAWVLLPNSTRWSIVSKTCAYLFYLQCIAWWTSSVARGLRILCTMAAIAIDRDRFILSWWLTSNTWVVFELVQNTIHTYR